MEGRKEYKPTYLMIRPWWFNFLFFSIVRCPFYGEIFHESTFFYFFFLFYFCSMFLVLCGLVRLKG